MSKSFKRLIERYLQYHERLEKINNRMNEGGLTKKQWKELEEEKEELQHEKGLIDRSKTGVLNNHIFPAMADLTVLLEKMREYPFIRVVFEDNVKNLFLAESNIKPGWFVFHRFVEACVCKWERGKGTQHEDSAALAPHFRAILGEYMQRAVFEMMKEMMPLKFEDSYFRDNIIIDDMTRPIVWSKFFANEARRKLNEERRNMESDEERRPALF